MKLWLTAGGFALAFIVAGIVLATREDLSEMDQLASVGSFVLALTTLAVTAMAAIRRRPSEPPPPSGQADIPGGHSTVGSINHATSVQVGNNTHATVNAPAKPPRRRRR